MMESFSPMRKASGASTAVQQSPSWVRRDAVTESPARFPHGTNGMPSTPVASHDGASTLLSTSTNEERVDHLRRGSYVRVEQCRDLFQALMNMQTWPATTEEFVASLEDGSFLVQLLLKITGVADRPSKLASLGTAGITAENFDRYAIPACLVARSSALPLSARTSQSRIPQCHR